MQTGDWRNWLARTVRNREADGSNPLSPTNSDILKININYILNS